MRSEALVRVLPNGRFATLIEEGLGSVEEPRRAELVLRAVRVAMPALVEGAGKGDLASLASAAWALDAFPGRDPGLAGDAEMLRKELLAPLGGPPGIADNEWACVPAGHFEMGSERGDSDEQPVHQVVVDSFEMLRRAVRGEEILPLLGGRPGDRAAEEGVTWYEAYLFAAWLGGRLPTEAEWEHAARLGGTAYAVEEEMRNRWGPYEMPGDGWEWVADWYRRYPEGPEDNPWGVDATPGSRVIRGGSVRSSDRGYGGPDGRSVSRFRVVRPARCPEATTPDSPSQPV